MLLYLIVLIIMVNSVIMRKGTVLMHMSKWSSNTRRINTRKCEEFLINTVDFAVSEKFCFDKSIINSFIKFVFWLQREYNTEQRLAIISQRCSYSANRLTSILLTIGISCLNIIKKNKEETDKWIIEKLMH